MPLDKTIEQYDIMDIIPGVMFWLFLVLGIVGQIILAVRWNRYLKLDRRKKTQTRKERVGLLAVFKNIPAIIADVGFLISLVVFAIVTKVTYGLSYACYILLTVCVFTFCLHCIFNGKIYKYVTKLSKEEDA